MTPAAPDDTGKRDRPSIGTLLAAAEHLTDVLPALHQRALDASNGTCSLLFEVSPHGPRLQATSGFALDSLEGGPWMPSAAEMQLADTALNGEPALIEDPAGQMPDLASRIRTPLLGLLPLSLAGKPRGLLVIGFDARPAVDFSALRGIADDFVIALELFRLRRQDDLHQDVRALLDEFSTTISATLDVGAGLEIICHRTRRLFGADRTSVWIHDRTARHLVLRASSDRELLSTAPRVSTDDLLSPAAAAMRRSRSAAIPGESAIYTVAVPLRGCRRALGALVFDGVRIEPGGELHLLDRADEVGRQLSSAVDSLQLIEGIGRSRSDLEQVCDALPCLVAVVDTRGRIVHANRPLASRLRSTPTRLRGRRLFDCVGSAIAGWLEDQNSGAPTEPRSRTLSDPLLGGPLLVTVSVRRSRGGSPAGLIMVARDTTQTDPEVTG